MTLNLYVIHGRGTDAAELAGKLRGGPVFDVLNADLEEFGVRVRRSKLSADEKSVDHPVPKVTHHTLLSLVDLAAVVDQIELWEQLRDSTTTIVDVHFPLGSLINVRSLQPGRNEKTRDLAADAEAQDFWDDSERQARAARILGEANVIVSPHKGWARLLEHWLATPRRWDGVAGQMAVPRRVRVLPDVNSAETGGQFFAALLSAMDAGVKTRLWETAPWWRRVLASVISPIAWSARRQMGRVMTKALIADDVDFSYAEVDD